MKVTIAGLSLLFCMPLMQAQEQEEIPPPQHVKYTVIFESGLTANYAHFSMEHTVVNGIILDGRHAIGLGLGIGVFGNDDIYTPVYVNYRHYFSVGKYAPFINTAVGGLMLTNGGGFYSTLTAGFRKHKFSFSSGIFFMAYRYYETYSRTVYDHDGFNPYQITEKDPVDKFPLGVIVKVGVTF
ncbi:MAG: hypothetical protein LBQ64_01145 [Bacteroidales bacterium]|nr:hypothetical protein [Bacteroidales bacterium]